MTEPETFSEDLPILARRAGASAAERRRLSMRLGSSVLEAWLYETGRTYDALLPPTPEDEPLLRRVVDRIRPSAAPARAPRSVRWGLIALITSTSVGAAALTLALSNVPRSITPVANGVPESSEYGTRVVTPDATPNSPPVVPSPVATMPVQRVAVSHRPAAEQFAAANALRSAGRVDSAMTAYRNLQREHPTASEAVLSHVLLGRLLVQKGKASEAAQAFGRYLSLSPYGSLAEEALHGQANALRQMGQKTAEQRTWEMLLARFPNSIYKKAAKERLQELL